MTEPFQDRSADKPKPGRFLPGSGTQYPAAERDGSHPDPETISSYRARQLPPEEEDAVQEHLISCEECVDLLLLHSGGPAEEREGVIDFEKELIWARMKAERADESIDEIKSQIEATRRQGRRGHHALAAAAMVIVALVGLSFYQGGVIQNLTSPQTNVAIHDVLQVDTHTRDKGETGGRVFEIPAGTYSYTVVIPVTAEAGDMCRIELLDAEGKRIWSDDGLVVDAYRYATLGLSRRFVQEGSYRIRIFGHGSQQPAGDFSFEIRYL